MAGHGPGGHMGRAYLTEEEKANRTKVTPALLRRIFSYLTPYWKQMLLVILAIFVSSTFKLMPSVLTGRIIDEGLIGRDMNALIRLILLSLAVTLGANLIGVFESYLNSWIAQHIAQQHVPPPAGDVPAFLHHQQPGRYHHPHDQ